MKKVLAIVLAVLMLTSLLTACGGSGSQNTEKSEVQKIIEQAQGMTLEELAKKANAISAALLEKRRIYG